LPTTTDASATTENASAPVQVGDAGIAGGGGGAGVESLPPPQAASTANVHAAGNRKSAERFVIMIPKSVRESVHPANGRNSAQR
jgi:hypothetical protein